MEGDGIAYEGHRFVARAQLAGKKYGDSFGVDVGVGDVLTEPPDVLEGSSLLSFVGLTRPTFRVYPRVTHVAEKVHAYTLPRERPNSRVKDLPDLALLATSGPFDSARLQSALDATFALRKTHVRPNALPRPPADWAKRYETMARDDDLPWATLDEVFLAARTFLDPILDGYTGSWDPNHARWNAIVPKP